MHRSPRALAVPTALLLASLPSAQQAPTPQRARLTLATVLERGPALAAPLPRTLWLPDGHDATVIVADADGNESLRRLVDGALVDPPVCTAAELLRALAPPAPGAPPGAPPGTPPGAGAAGAEPDQKPPLRFPELSWRDAETLRVEVDGAVFYWRPGAAAAEVALRWPEPDAQSEFREPMVAVAPGDRHAAVRKDHELWLAKKDGALHRLTWDGSDDVVYGGAAHRAEFGIDRGLFWSPDGRFLAFYREDLRAVAPYPYQDLAAMPPAPHAGRYPMAGRAQGKVEVGVCDTNDRSIVWLAHDPDADVFWTNLGFAPADARLPSGSLTVTLVDRGQDRLELVRFDPTTGARVATLLREQDAEWIEPEHPPTFLADGRFLWWSRKSGHRHLWLRAADGSELAQVTDGHFDVQELLGVVDQRTVWFAASGEDPRQRHLFAAELPSKQPAAPSARQVTRGRGTHLPSLAPDGKLAHVVWSNLETRPVARVIETTDGGVLATLPQPLDPLADFALPEQRFFQLATDDDAVLYGHLALPPVLAPGQRCPVLLYVYGGPHVQLVTDQWLGGAPLWLQAFAAEGFAVCRLDNRGTPNRGEVFEQAVYRHLGTVEVEDQLRAVAWLREQPFVDPARIGVHGWSFGGYMTLRLMLLAPATFACGVSGAPVTDWAMYETGYGERYMDTPAENPDGYAASSCLPLAGKLQRPLLVVQGTDDRTVVPAHTLAFVDRCIDAGVAVEYFPYPMQLHGLRGKDRGYFLQQLRRYLVEHLHPEERAAPPPASDGAKDR